MSASDMTPDLQALIELSDDDLCDVIEMMDAMEVARIMRRLAAAPTLPGAGGGDALDARRWKAVRNFASGEDFDRWEDMARGGHIPSKEGNDYADHRSDALPPQQGG